MKRQSKVCPKQRDGVTIYCNFHTHTIYHGRIWGCCPHRWITKLGH